MVDCSLELSCRDQDSWINGPWSSLSVQVCASGLKCGNTAYILINSTVICLTDCEMKRNNPEHLPWVRPVTCAAIAVSALIFFMLLYFGKTWTESRGTSERRAYRKQEFTTEGQNWSRMKISVLAGNRNVYPPEPPRQP
ncbi:uncharacterized protein LOC111711005 [Eurytemora carolleeae]|uniref:uncharacterized protein LOC111711005 n=1 Tax=Eurytemora carolleeae TaxID=1294199 RepID=UPI000C77858C|nr:uncharacterized protein LOC111711005 [Eurytemora carolleeae]|eukprot:XP_023340992.1 uncharacterized protein LOC111711005 [Eurytemora affinis]